MKSLLAALLLATALPALAATNVAGVKFEDKAKVGAGETALNGAGMRNKLFFRAYAMALYLPQKAPSASEALVAKGPKRSPS